MLQEREVQLIQASYSGSRPDRAIRTLPLVTNGAAPLSKAPDAPGIRAHGSDTRFRALFECQPEGVAIFDSRGALVDVNPAAERILGLSRAQLFDLPIRDPRIRAPGPIGTAMLHCNHPIVIALETKREVRGSILGVFNSALNETRWLTVDAIPHLCRSEPRGRRCSRSSAPSRRRNRTAPRSSRP